VANSENHSHHHYHIGLIILLILVAAVAVKFHFRQEKWHRYVVDSIDKTRDVRLQNSVEDAGVIATTIVSIPSGNPIYKQTAALEAYVQTISSQTGRDIVIVDTKEKILADTVALNVGKIYTEDKEDEVSKTLVDGQARFFVEKGVDYPSGVNETVISFKDTKGSVIGALIMSDSKIFN